MKRILSLLCVLMTVCTSAWADNDYLLEKAAELLALTREKTTVLHLYTGSPDILQTAEKIAEDLQREVQSVSVLPFDNTGAFVRIMALYGESEMPSVSPALSAQLDASVPAALITQCQSMLGSQELATVTLMNVNVTEGAQLDSDALVLLDFAEDYQLACLLTAENGVVTGIGRPVHRDVDLLNVFSSFYGLTNEQILSFPGLN